MTMWQWGGCKVGGNRLCARQPVEMTVFLLECKNTTHTLTVHTFRWQGASLRACLLPTGVPRKSRPDGGRHGASGAGVISYPSAPIASLLADNHLNPHIPNNARQLEQPSYVWRSGTPRSEPGRSRGPG